MKWSNKIGGEVPQVPHQRKQIGQQPVEVPQPLLEGLVLRNRTRGEQNHYEGIGSNEAHEVYFVCIF